MEENGTAAATGFLNLRPVNPEESGEGLPYAPENFPNQGDIWGWRTGRRITPTGMFQDRYLYLPDRLNRVEVIAGSSRKQKHIFASRLSVERYVKANFPDADIEAFFASFSWRIPAIPGAAAANGVPIAAVPLKQVPHTEETEIDVVKCKAGNKMCDSLVPEEVEKYLPAMPCDICCTEPGFCRDCSCILCSKSVSSAYSGYSFIKCSVNTGEGICGHVAHLECGLRARLAGTVGRSIGLDAEYHCRRCDGRSDLISHAKNLLQTCDATDLDDEIQRKILNLGACLLRGSQKADAKELLKHIELAISNKVLKCATNLEDVLKVDGKLNTHSGDLSGHGIDEMGVTVNGSPSDARKVKESCDCDHLPPSVKLEIEVEEILYDLKKSQELEYRIAEERLQEHKTYLQNLYQQIDYEKSELAGRDESRAGGLFDNIRERKKQISREVKKFEEMKKIANGFGRTSKEILKEHFDMEEAKD